MSLAGQEVSRVIKWTSPLTPFGGAPKWGLAGIFPENFSVAPRASTSRGRLKKNFCEKVIFVKSDFRKNEKMQNSFSSEKFSGHHKST
jgi:hypothetical protein